MSQSYPRGMVLPDNFDLHRASQNIHAASVLQSLSFTDSAYATGLPPAGRVPLPTDASLDWCTPGLVIAGQSIVTPVQNQSQCGCCWDFAFIAATESSIAKNFHVRVGISEQYVLDSAIVLETAQNDIPFNCSGGWWPGDLLSTSKNLVQLPGAPSRSAVPYKGAWGPYPYTDDAVPRPYSILTWGYVAGGIDATAPPTDAQLKAALCTYGPLAICVTTDGSWDAYAGGVLAGMPNNPRVAIDHAVVLVGWDNVAGGWNIKNSWGTAFGEAGFIRVKYGTFNVGVGASWVQANPPKGWVAPTPNPQPAPTPPGPAPVVLTLKSSDNTPTVGQVVTITATVTSTAKAPLNGTVGFDVNNNDTLAASLAPDANGVAAYTFTATSPGPVNFEVKFHGDGVTVKDSENVGLKLTVVAAPPAPVPVAPVFSVTFPVANAGVANVTANSVNFPSAANYLLTIVKAPPTGVPSPVVVSQHPDFWSDAVDFFTSAFAWYEAHQTELKAAAAAIAALKPAAQDGLALIKHLTATEVKPVVKLSLESNAV